MRALIVLALVGSCGGEKTKDPPAAVKPQPTSGSGSEVPERPKLSMGSTKPVELPTAASMTLSKVRIVPIVSMSNDRKLEHTAGMFDLKFTPSSGSFNVFSRIMCRIADRNLVTFSFKPEPAEGNELSNLFNPQPFAAAPSACEFVWYYGSKDDKRPTKPLATACYDGTEIKAGACAAEKFPAPVLHPGVTGMIEQMIAQDTRPDSSSFGMNAVVTVGPSFAAGRQLLTFTRCEDGTSVRKSKHPDDETVAGWEIQLLPPGGSIFVIHGAFLDGAVAEKTRCELDLKSRPFHPSDSNKKPPKADMHATHCITDEKIALGPCDPPLGKAK